MLTGGIGETGLQRFGHFLGDLGVDYSRRIMIQIDFGHGDLLKKVVAGIDADDGRAINKSCLSDARRQ